jgi:GNAT superfamily N-acetyltransferase
MEITTWYLEQTSPTDLVAVAEPAQPLTIMQAEQPTPEFSRFLYTAVGGPWHWRGRLPWTWRQWQEWLDKPGLETWVVYLHGTPAGYAELVKHDDGSVEVNSFGLLPTFVGKGIGRYFLSWVLDTPGSSPPPASGCTPAPWTARTPWPTTRHAGCASTTSRSAPRRSPTTRPARGPERNRGSRCPTSLG